MKKVSVLLPSAIALMLVVSPMLAAQDRPGNGSGQLRQEFANKLGLTDAQKQAMKSIRDSVQKDIYDNVLNAEQRTQYNAAVQSGEKPGKILRSLNSSEAQQSTIRDKMKAARQRINQEVLTDAQRAQIQQMRQQRGNRRGA